MARTKKLITCGTEKPKIANFAGYPQAKKDMLKFLKGSKKYCDGKFMVRRQEWKESCRCFKAAILEEKEEEVCTYLSLREYLNVAYWLLMLYNILPVSFFGNTMKVLKKCHRLKCCSYVKSNLKEMTEEVDWDSQTKSKFLNALVSVRKDGKDKVDMKDIDKFVNGDIRIDIDEEGYHVIGVDEKCRIKLNKKKKAEEKKQEPAAEKEKEVVEVDENATD